MDDRDGIITIHHEIATAQAVVRIMSLADTDAFSDSLKSADVWRLSLGPTSRLEQARGCFVDRWGPHRFERLGTMLLIPPGLNLLVRGEHGSTSSIICHLNRALIDPWLMHGSHWDDRQLEAFLDLREPIVRSLLLRMGQEAHRPGAGSARLIESGAVMLGIELARYCDAVADGPLRGGLAAWRLRLIDERLKASEATPGLAELASICGMSVRQMTRGFRLSRNCSIHEHIARSRIEQAKRLLNLDDSVKTVAFAVGFQSVSSFSTAFRRATGISPRAFRQRLRRTD